MRKLARTLAVVALSAGTISMLAVVPARASTTPTPQRYPICNPSHPIHPCQNNF
jgi:hypothetical protein